jgi:hypothetical protein
MASLNITKGFSAFVNSTQKTWQHDRSKSVGASEVFGCLRKAHFKKFDYEKDPDHEDRWGALRRGDTMENHFVEPAMKWLLENMTDAGQLLFSGTDQKTFIEGYLSATPDGLAIDVDSDSLAEYAVPDLANGLEGRQYGCFVFEIKSIDPRVNLKEEKFVHRGQVMAQMGLIREKTAWKPQYAMICYVDCSFYDEIEVFIVPFDQRVYDIAKLRAKQVFESAVDELQAEGKIDGGCQYCEFTIACARVNKEATPTKERGGREANHGNVKPELIKEFDDLVTKERAASSAKKVAEVEHKAATEDLKAWFRNTGFYRAVSGDVTVSLSWIKGRKSLDKSALIADGIDPEMYMKEGEGYDRLNISEKGSRRADED